VIYVNGRFLTQPLSGVQRFATEITTALRRLRGETVVTLAPPGARVDVGAVRLVGRRRGHVWEQLELPRHAAGGVLVNLGNTAPLRASPQVVVVHDGGVFATPEAYSWKFRLFYRLLQRALVRSGAAVVAVSEFARAEICRHLGAEPGRVAVIGEGADHMHRIVADPAILARAGLVPGQFVLVVGNLAAHKNLAALGVLARALADRGMTLAVAGGLPAAAFRAQGNGALPQPARYLGRIDDKELKALYETAACFVFPSRYEGFGLPAVEAMACGCLVVAADIPALRETCGEAAIYCDPASPQDIARTVCRVLDEPALAARARSAAPARLAEHTWDRAARRLDEAVAAFDCSSVGAIGVPMSARRANPCASR
jgi:glycosyltransferase involved in cell wall biosynthesis